MFNIGGNPAITEGNTVFVRADRHMKGFPASGAGVNTLVHEATHVRRYRQMGFGVFYARHAGDLAGAGDRDEVYDYRSRTGDFRAETEGQAQMVGGYRATRPASATRRRPISPVSRTG